MHEGTVQEAPAARRGLLCFRGGGSPSDRNPMIVALGRPNSTKLACSFAKKSLGTATCWRRSANTSISPPGPAVAKWRNIHLDVPIRVGLLLSRGLDIVVTVMASAADPERYVADDCAPLVAAAARGAVQLHSLARSHYPGRRLPGASVPELLSIGYWDAQTPQAWGLEWHRNEGIEVTFVSRGSVHFATRAGGAELQSGHVTVTPPWREHRVGDPTVGASRVHWLILDVGIRASDDPWVWPSWITMSRPDLDRLRRHLQSSTALAWQGNAALERYFEGAATLALSADQSAVESDLRVIVSAIFLELLRSIDGSALASDRISERASLRRVADFLKSIDDHLERDWSVDAMARACGVGRTQFTRYCERVTNCAPSEFLHSRRLARSRDLLTQTRLSVLEIAVRCGFDSSQYFATRFKREHGCTPSEFRLAARARSSGDQT